MGDRLWAGIPSCNQPTRSTQPCIPPDSLNRVPASAGVKAGWNVTSAGWQVTRCDPIWHVSSSSGVATSVSELLVCYPCYFTLLLLYFNTMWPGPRPTSMQSAMLIHPCSRLATIDMGRELGRWLRPLFGRGELGPHLTQCRLGRGLYLHTTWHLGAFSHLAAIHTGQKFGGSASFFGAGAAGSPFPI